MKKNKIIRTGLSLAMVFSLFALTGCNKKESENTETIAEIINTLETEPNLTTVDENMNQGLDGETLEDIDKQYHLALEKNSISDCNKALKKLSYLTIKSIVAESIGQNPNDFKSFKIIGNKSDYFLGFGNDTAYGIQYEINYESQKPENHITGLSDKHTLRAAGEEAIQVCIIYRAAEKEQLAMNGNRDWSGKYIPSIKESYDILKNILTKDFAEANQNHKKAGIEFDGTIELQNNPEKEETIKTYAKSRH